MSHKNKEIEELIEDFPKYISLILEGVYDVNVPFVHNKDQFVSYCEYCG